MNIFDTGTLWITPTEVIETTSNSKIATLSSDEITKLIYKAQASIQAFVNVWEATEDDLKRATFYTLDFQFSHREVQVTSEKAWDRQVNYKEKSDIQTRIEAFGLPMKAYDILKKYKTQFFKNIQC